MLSIVVKYYWLNNSMSSGGSGTIAKWCLDHVEENLSKHDGFNSQ